MYTVPTGKLFRRGKGDERKEDKYDRGFGSNLGLAAANSMGQDRREREPNYYKRLEDVLTIHTKQENPNTLNFQELYQENLPPAARELGEYVKNIKDKDNSKDKEIQKVQNNAREKLRRVQNLVPENKT